MRNSTAATKRSLDLRRRPVSGHVCLKRNENRKSMSVQLKVCAVNGVGLYILNNTILQVEIKQDGSYCIVCSLSYC